MSWNNGESPETALINLSGEVAEATVYYKGKYRAPKDLPPTALRNFLKQRIDALFPNPSKAA